MTGTMPFRLILHGSGPGYFNMAVDEMLLEAVSSGKSGPVIRLYTFDHNTLSAGRFQNVREEFDPGALSRQGISLVRRPTGGRAVLHNHELTYSVVLGKDHITPFSKRRVYMFIVPLLLGGLAELGLEDALHSAQHGDLKSPDCFAATGEYEIDSRAGRKLIGSAQMITREAVLQHGSIPIESRERGIMDLLLPSVREKAGQAGDTENHEFSSIADEIGRVPEFDEVRAAFAHTVRKAVPCTPSELTERETGRIEELVREKYGVASWNWLL